jgi:hypothetical protein
MFFIDVHFNGRDIIPHHYNTPRGPNMGIIDHLGAGYQLTDIFVVNSRFVFVWVSRKHMSKTFVAKGAGKGSPGISLARA